MPGRKPDWDLVRRTSAKVAKRMFDAFDRKRRNILTDIAYEFYPLGVAGLVRRAEAVADECHYDEDHRLLTSRPLCALRNGACGFKNHLTPNAGGWFRFHEAGGDGDVDSKTLDRLATAVERAFSRSRAYDSLYKLYEHILCFGFGCILVTRHPTQTVRVRTLRVGTYAMEVNDDGEVCRIARKFSWTAEQIVRRFGDAGAPESVRKAAKDGDGERRWTVVNLVEPNASGDMRAYDRVARELPLVDEMIYRSIYFIEGEKDCGPQGGILEASGFSVKPIVAPRLDCELGDVYGRGRGADALCIARGCQSFQHDILRIDGRQAEPPLVVSSEFKDQGFRAGRGGINYARFGEQRGALALPVFPQQIDTTPVRQDRVDAEAEIAELFFNSSFAAIDALKNNPGVKTATEVDALVRENMEKLGPIVMNLERELLDPLVSAVAHYVVAECADPLEPEDVEAIGSVDVEYVSRLHMAANVQKVSTIDSWISRLAPLAEARPEVMDNVDADGVAKVYAEMLGVPAEARADEEAVAATRQQRAEMAKMQQEQARLTALGNLAKVGSVPTDKDHLGGVIAQQGEETEQ